MIIKIISILLLYHTLSYPPHAYLGTAIMIIDGYSYINGVENFIRYHDYGPPCRAPYVGLFYGIFRLFFAPPLSANMFILMQLLLSSLAIFYFLKIIEELFNNTIYVYISLFLFSTILIFSFYDLHISSESLAISFLIFFTYNIFKSYNLFSFRYYFFSSIFLSLLISIKNYFFPFIIIVPFMFYYFRKNTLGTRAKLKLGLYTILPFIILIFPWCIRNYIKYNKFICFQMSLLPCYELHISQEYYDIIKILTDAPESFYFNNSYSLNNPMNQVLLLERLIKKNNLSSSLIESKIIKLKDLINGNNEYKTFNDIKNDPEYDKTLKEIKDILSKNKYLYVLKIYNKCKNLIYFLFRETVSFIPKKLLVFKLVNYFIYLLLLLSTLLTIIKFNKTDLHHRFFYSLMFTFIIFLIVTFPVVLGRIEHRYFTTIYPYLIVFFILLLDSIIKYFKCKQLIMKTSTLPFLILIFYLLSHILSL